MAKGKVTLGKVDFNRTGRKANEVDIEWELTPDGRFTASGSIWDANHTDTLSGGQNLETIARLFPRDERVQRIVKVWRNWHLNDLKAGTPSQERVVNAWLAKKGNKYDYDKVVAHLKSIGMYEDNGYRYGTRWLKEEIPTDIKNEIRYWSNFPQGELGDYLDIGGLSPYERVATSGKRGRRGKTKPRKVPSRRTGPSLRMMR